jgi:diguanylate cyclase (GGDEF)-like protein/PAS domain S-box-containing protein
MEFLDSEMMKRFMHSAPVNIFFKDAECKYRFASEICDLVYAGENGSIVGKTDLEVQKFPEMGKMYYEDDKKILATGEGSQYINEFPMEDGESLYFEIKKSAVRDENGNIIGIVGIVDNVTERVRLEKKVEELSVIDGLTGVYNRNYLKYRVEEKKKKLIFPFTVIMSDCNYLKKVNDQFGHEYGDILLKIVADTLKEEMPEDSPVIRMGGDEFMILGNGITEEKASELMANIQESLKRKSKEKIPLRLAMGSYTVQSKEFSFEEVCHEADLRMYADKKRLKADESTEITE